ncbi:uncharacterized protein ARMOST_08947 [Armillaria ostoyae]|uniref:Uncharacterized protein n=1 Tax=Armillaria ostoyae TaxID=47428 RepID=A0A284RA66_ARMOS|nr:uncharacterized protein ARMOST_08947 [Armillaria ostoyae]
MQRSWSDVGTYTELEPEIAGLTCGVRVKMIASVLPPQPALSDLSTTREDLEAAKTLAKVTSPPETPLFICACQGTVLIYIVDAQVIYDTGCFRLFPSRDRVTAHRKRDHLDTPDDDSTVITWNE